MAVVVLRVGRPVALVVRVLVAAPVLVVPAVLVRVVPVPVRVARRVPVVALVRLVVTLVEVVPVEREWAPVGPDDRGLAAPEQAAREVRRGARTTAATGEPAVARPVSAEVRAGRRARCGRVVSGRVATRVSTPASNAPIEVSASSVRIDRAAMIDRSATIDRAAMIVRPVVTARLVGLVPRGNVANGAIVAIGPSAATGRHVAAVPATVADLVGLVVVLAAPAAAVVESGVMEQGVVVPAGRCVAAIGCRRGASSVS